MSQKKKKKWGVWEGEEGRRETHTNANFQKEKKKKSGLILDSLDPGSWRPREVGVSARRGASNEKMSGRRRSFTNCTPASPTASSPPLLEPFPRFPPPLSPHRLASDCLTRDGEEQVSLPERSPSVCPSLPQALLGSSPAGRRRDSVPRAGCRMCLRGYRASRSVAAPGSGQPISACSLGPPGESGAVPLRFWGVGRRRQAARPGGGGCFSQLRNPREAPET